MIAGGKGVSLTRLETRTKESIMYASIEGVSNLCLIFYQLTLCWLMKKRECVMKVNVGGKSDRSHVVL